MNKVLRNIIITVVGVHLSGILWCVFAPTPLPPKKETFVVKTVKLIEPKKVTHIQQPPVQIAAVPAPSIPAPAPAPAPKPKKEIPKKTVAKKIEKKIPPPVKKPSTPAQPSKKEELLAKAKGLVAGLNKKSTPLNLPKLGTIDKLQIDTPAEISIEEVHYHDLLALHLKEMVQLPEYGKVKIKLTLNRKGEVLEMKVLHSESKMNQKHIEKMISGLTFPSFDAYIKDSKHTFTITLQNE